MSKTYVFPIAVALMIVPIYLDRADAIPLVSRDLAAVAPSSNAEPVYYRAAVRGPRGGVAVRGPRGAVAVGPRGGVGGSRRRVSRRRSLLRRRLVRYRTPMVWRSLVALRCRQLLGALSHRLRLDMWVRAELCEGWYFANPRRTRGHQSRNRERDGLIVVPFCLQDAPLGLLVLPFQIYFWHTRSRFIERNSASDPIRRN